MRKAAAFTLLLLSTGLLALAQNSDRVALIEANTICYKAERLNQEFYKPSSGEVAFSKVFGTNVIIFCDTVFKRYVFHFNDINGKKTAMVLNYVRPYFPNSKDMLLMEWEGDKFLLVDWIGRPPFTMTIKSEEANWGFAISLAYKISFAEAIE